MSEVEMLGTTDYEKTLWEKFHAGTTESRHYKSQTQKEFRVLFPNGHKDSIRDLFAEIAEKAKFGKRLNKVFGSLSNVHPRAWDIILEYGKDYVPTSWVNSTPQESSWQPTAGFCFQNAYELMKVSQDGLDRPSRLTYVEGFAMGPTALPMLHAWNGSGFSKRAVDWTFYAHSTWVRYFGIPFTHDEYRELSDAFDAQNPKMIMLFRKDCFEQIEETLHTILKRPRQRLSLSRAERTYKSKHSHTIAFQD